MACISLGKIDKNFIPIFTGCIFCFLNRLLHQYDGALLFKNPIMMNICISSSKFFAFIPYFIHKIIDNHAFISHNKIANDNERTKSSSKVKYLYSDESKQFFKGKWKYLFLSSIIFLFNQLLFVLTIQVRSNTTILNILITSLFYYLIFKTKLYKHHYLSIFLIILIGFIIDIILGNLQHDLNNDLILLFLRILREIVYSLSSVFDKYIMVKKFCSVYEILLTDGVINTILFILFAVLDYNFFEFDNYEEYFNNFDNIELLVIFGELITQLGLNLFILSANEKNTPCHVFIIFIFGQLAYYIDFTGINLIVIFCLILILLLSLIFNEIIEINFLGLSYNTKRNISQRAENEDNKITLIDIEDSLLDENNIKEKEVMNGETELSEIYS